MGIHYFHDAKGKEAIEGKWEVTEKWKENVESGVTEFKGGEHYGKTASDAIDVSS